MNGIFFSGTIRPLPVYNENLMKSLKPEHIHVDKEDKKVNRQILRFFWTASTQHKTYFYLTVLLHSPSFFLGSVLVPVLIAYGLEALINKDIDTVAHYALLIILTSLAANILLAIATWAFNRNGTYAQRYVVEHAFESFLHKDYAFFSNTFIGSLGSHIVQLREAMNVFNKLLFFDIPRISVFLIAGIGVIALQSPVLATITFVFIALTFSYMLLFGKYRLKYRRELSRQSSSLGAVVGDALAHGTTVKSFANERYEASRLSIALDAFRKAQIKSWDLFIPNNIPRNIFVGIGTAALLLFSVHLYSADKISFAVVVLVQLYVVKVINVAVDLGDAIKSYDIFMGQAYQPVATMLEPAQIAEPKKPRKIKQPDSVTIRLQGLKYAYPDAKRGSNAISDINLSVTQGQRIGVIGYSGGGKTTLTKLLMRFMDVSEGSITVNDVDIRDMAQADLRRLIAYVPQEPLLFHRSIRENIAYAKPHASETEIISAAKMAYVDEFVDELPNRYDTMVGERGVKLSGGQRQRVAIARALLKDSPLLVLDEATSALDSHSEARIQEALWSLMKDRTAIVVAHRLSTIRKLDTIIVIDKGKIVASGSHEDLLLTSGIYKRLWAHQSGGYISS